MVAYTASRWAEEYMLRSMLLICIVALLGAQAAVLDDFNRPDAPTLGPNWSTQWGGAEIIGDQAVSIPGVNERALVTYNGYTATSSYVDVFLNGATLQYAALVLAYGDVDNNFLIKVQQQDPYVGFNHYAFYYGQQGTGLFGTLVSPFSEARLTASFVGRDAWLSIDTNFDGTPEQVYSFTYSQDPAGSGFGLGFYGVAHVDNFGSDTATASIPEPGTFAVFAGALAALALVRRRLAN